MIRKALIALAAVALIGAAIGLYLWNKPHENMQTATADTSLTATALFEAYNTDENAANTDYLGKTIAVTGEVRESNRNDAGDVQVVLETGDMLGGVVCQLDPLSNHKRNTFNPGETVTFKGKCDGFNIDVQLSRCVESNQ